MRYQILFFLLLTLGCSSGQNESKSEDQMKEIEINNLNGNLILKTQTVNNRLDGKCTWFNSDGEVLSDGVFDNGKPYEGSFLDWSLYFQGENISYDPESYCQDWVSTFEGSFLSKKVDYSLVTVVYKNGIKVD